MVLVLVVCVCVCVRVRTRCVLAIPVEVSACMLTMYSSGCVFDVSRRRRLLFHCCLAFGGNVLTKFYFRKYTKMYLTNFDLKFNFISVVASPVNASTPVCLQIRNLLSKCVQAQLLRFLSYIIFTVASPLATG